MYGYLRLVGSVTPPSMQRYYRNLYCSLCHALWNNYGLKSRFILSYDMTFIAVVLNLKGFVCLDDRLVCYKRVDINDDKEEWKRLAAMAILLAGKKLEDDINDENDRKAKIGHLVFRRAFSKAENDYPEASAIFEQGFGDMSKMEKQKADVFTLAERFSQIMVDAAGELFQCSEEEKAVMYHVSKWIYFIDALDDLDKDIQTGSFNPFKSFAQSKKDLISNHYVYIEDFISRQMEAVMPSLSVFSDGSERGWIILSTLLDTLPIVTKRVMKDEHAYAKGSLLTKVMESKGGYQLA